MSPDKKPGTRSLGPAQNYDIDEFEKQFRQEVEDVRKKKDDLIASSLSAGSITPEMAALFRSFKTSTFGNYEEGNLGKIQAVLAFREKALKAEGLVAYIGSGTDWHFPVALGLTQIDMVDISYPEILDKLVSSIKEFDTEPEIEKEDSIVNTVRFRVNLGNGERQIKLNIIPGGADAYSPSQFLAGVIESYGPTKMNDGTSPVLSNVAEKLTLGAFILNLDFDRTRLREGNGLEDHTKEDLPFYTVSDVKSLYGTSQLSKNRAISISLEAIRKASGISEE